MDRVQGGYGSLSLGYAEMRRSNVYMCFFADTARILQDN